MDFQKDEGVDWNDLAQDRDRCRVFMKAAMKFQGALNAGNFFTNGGPISLSVRKDSAPWN
jgi:hypothetical protein